MIEVTPTESLSLWRMLQGKSSVTRIVTERLEARWSKKVAVISLDDFYLGLRTPEVLRAWGSEYSLPTP